MSRKLQSYLRTERKRHGFTQAEIAFLLGCQSGTVVSRFERLSREANLETAFACQVIFGIPAHELFSGIYQQVEKRITHRARLLLQQLQTTSPSNSQKKRAVLEGLLASEETERALFHEEHT